MGVYPVDRIPFPHPQCLCYRTEVLPTLEESAELLGKWARGEAASPEMDAGFERWKAENREELKNLLRKSLLLMGLAGICLTGLAEALTIPLAHLFVGYDATLYALTVHAFRIFSFSFLLTGINIYVSGFFTALNNGGVSALIAVLRTLVFQSASVLLLPLLFGVDGVWWAITAAEVFALIVSLAMLFFNRKKYGYF